MDATKKPLLIPPEFSTYAEKHGIYQVYEVSYIYLLLCICIIFFQFSILKLQCFQLQFYRDFQIYYGFKIKIKGIQSQRNLSYLSNKYYTFPHFLVNQYQAVSNKTALFSALSGALFKGFVNSVSDYSEILCFRFIYKTE